ncbi:MAG: phage holin family protein [Candidatus Dormiibacterota bacterium]
MPADKTVAPSKELAKGLVDDAQKLVEVQIALAKAEVRGLVVRNGVAVGMFAFAALLLVLAIFVAMPVLVVVWLPQHVLVAAIWIGAYVLVAIILAIVGRFTLKLQPPVRTIAALKETKEWLVRQISSARK